MNTVRKWILVLLAIVIAVTMTFAVVTPASAQPSEVWVDDDYCNGCSNNGHTWSYDAFATIQDGIDAVASPGTVHVAAGTYSEQVMISSKNEVTILGEDKHTTIVDGTGITWGANGLFNLDYLTNKITINGFTVRNGVYGIRADSSGDHTFKHNIITSNDTGGIQLFSSNNNTIAHNEISSNLSQDGIGVSGGSGNVIIANHIIANERCGILLYGAIDHVVTNNVIVNNGRDGIYCYNGSSANTSNNTVVGHAGYGIYADDSSLIVINNSIIWRNGDDLDGCTATYSNIRDGDAGEGNISAYPVFVDPENGDYHLKDYSPCIGAGTPTGAPDTDIEDNPRPNPPESNPDIGAYENSLGVPNTPPDPATIRVPIDYPTIQAAIDAASHGDTVLVADGTYTGAGNKNLDFKGKAIVVQSENGPENCIIDCEGDGRGFHFHSIERKDSIVSGFTITNGRTERGGGIYCKDSSSPTIINCIIKENSTIGVDEDGYYGDGAGILCEDSSPDIVNCTLSRNSASWRGGAIYCDNSSPTITNSIISDNSAQQSGGGIMCVELSSSTIANCTISENTGSGIVCSHNSSPIITNCNINENSEGGIVLGHNSFPTITNCTINGNSRGSGGGIYLFYYSSPTIENCTISGNFGSADGGGISIGSHSSPIIKNCIIVQNSARDYGGGIDIYGFGYDSNPSFINCTISGNSALNENGGGISCRYSSPTFENCVISENSADYAGGIYTNTCSPTITNCTISGNSAYYDVGGIYCEDHSLTTINNCIFWDDSPNEIYVTDSEFTITYSDVEGGWEGEGNISEDPMFFYPAGGDYHLRPDSPCIDTGTSEGAPDIDFEGESRPDDGDGDGFAAVDMGADEYVDTDRDGLPDYWEKRYFGSIDEIPSSDPDNDGFTNIQEYQNRTDPMKADIPEIIFGIDNGNRWTYQGSRNGESYILEAEVISFDKTTFPTLTYIIESRKDGIFESNEWYQTSQEELKLWGIRGEIGGYFDTYKSSDGLVSAWYPMKVNDHKVSSATVYAEGGDFFLKVRLTVDVLKKEPVILSFDTLEAYKLRYRLLWRVSGEEGTEKYSEWVVPYLGVVKYKDAKFVEKLTSFSIYGGDITQETDADGDGLKDYQELIVHGTNWLVADTDGDGMPDGWEVYYGLDPLVDDAHEDLDGDGLDNLDEFLNNTEPDNPDTDGDGMPDGWEVYYGLNPLVNDALEDSDGDGFSNLREYLAGTDPTDSGDIPAEATTVYVDDDNTSGIEDGSELHPFNTIQEGVDFGGPGDAVLVSAGNYGENLTLEDGIEILGAGADVTTIDGGFSGSVVAAIDVGPETVLDGFTIKNGAGDPDGGGILVSNSSLQISNNIIAENTARDGGGILVTGSSNPQIIGNVIEANVAEGGAGIHVSNGSSAVIARNLITGNEAKVSGGGGIRIEFATSAIVVNNIVVGNTAQTEGGGLFVGSSPSVVIVNNTIVGNEALEENGGGGIFNTTAEPVITNNIISQNNNFGVVEDIDAMGETPSDPLLSFNLFFGNTPAIYLDEYTTPLDTIGEVNALAEAENNISGDPIFVDPANGDYHVHVGSPCIDAGDNGALELPDTDFEGDTRISNAVVDIGADEYLPYAEVTLLAPNGGNIIPSGSEYTIRWDGPEEAVSFKVKCSLNNGTTWKTLEKEIADYSFVWLVPTPTKDKKKCLVKVIGYDGSDEKVSADKSDAPFTISMVRVTNPNGGETLISASTYTIEWETHGTKKPVERIKLLYTKNGGRTWNNIDTLEGDPGFHDWTVPDVPKTKTKCKVKMVLKDANGKTVGSDTSDGFFTIQP